MDDPGERAAEQTADQVLHMRPISAVPPAGSGRGEAAGVPVPGPGEPMDAAVRAFIEPRFGFDFRDVCVHSGGEAVASARALGARAYAIGRHVVFDEGECSPSNACGRRLLAHDLAHVVQDDTGHVVRRQPKPPRKWAQIWLEFASARADKPALATALANELASTPSEGDDLLEHGMEVVDWLHTHGSAPAALRLLADVRKRFKVGTTAGGKPLRFWDFQSLRPSQDPEILIARGKAAARAGQILGCALRLAGRDEATLELVPLSWVWLTASQARATVSPSGPARREGGAARRGQQAHASGTSRGWWQELESEGLIGRHYAWYAADKPTDKRRIVPPAPGVVGGNPIAERHVEADVRIDIGRRRERDLGGAEEIGHRAVGRGLGALLHDKAEGGVHGVLAELPTDGDAGTGGVGRGQRP